MKKPQKLYFGFFLCVKVRGKNGTRSGSNAKAPEFNFIIINLMIERWKNTYNDNAALNAYDCLLKCNLDKTGPCC